MVSKSILIVDDESPQRTVLAGYLNGKGYNVLEAKSADEALDIVKSNIIDIILTDYKMPGKTGFDLLRDVKNINPEISTVIITAFGTIEDAVRAMKEGAYDYITKPVELDELDLLVKRIIERQHLMSENKMLREQLSDKYKLSGIIAVSKKMEEVLSISARVAESKASVLIRGESGTGKELLAKAIHFAGPRKDKTFIAVNCAALNENLLESEIFGHEKGAFTGADKQRIGRFELADGGTLFLDEIGDLPLSTQVKLLRVLQEQKFERVGSSKTTSADVRVIAATNRNLAKLIQEGKFRDDLFYRLNVVTIEIPPLRERREDIKPLIEFYTRKFAQETKYPNLAFSKEAFDLMLKYSYPGNVRELENIVHRAVVLSRNELVTTSEISASMEVQQSEQDNQIENLDLSAQVEMLERKLVTKALEETKGNQTQAANLLGISERNLRYRLNKWGLKN